VRCAGDGAVEDEVELAPGLLTVASRPTKAFSDEADHVGHVDAWLDGAAKTLTSAQLITLFEQALGALWRRTEVTLGEVTLTAIVDRVLYTAS
jgi:hypothetical protein